MENILPVPDGRKHRVCLQMQQQGGISSQHNPLGATGAKKVFVVGVFEQQPPPGAHSQ